MDGWMNEWMDKRVDKSMNKKNKLQKNFFISTPKNWMNTNFEANVLCLTKVSSM